MNKYLENISVDKKKRASIIVDHASYDYSQLKDCLQMLSINKTGSNVVTRICGSKTCEMLPSDRYGIFDFSNFLIDTLPVVSQNFDIEYVDLKLERGVQEFKAYSKEIEIDKEIFKPVFTVFSSSNGYYPLIICVGLFRLICSNGLMVPFNNNQFNVKLKHYSKSIPFVETDFKERLPFLSEEIAENIRLIQDLKGERISFRETVHKLLHNKSDNEERITMLNNLKRFSNNIIKSPTDAINPADFSENQLNSIQNPLGLLNGESPKFEDLELDKYRVYNLYTEIFKKRNTSVIAQENSRIINVLKTI